MGNVDICTVSFTQQCFMCFIHASFLTASLDRLFVPHKDFSILGKVSEFFITTSLELGIMYYAHSILLVEVIAPFLAASVNEAIKSSKHCRVAALILAACSINSFSLWGRTLRRRRPLLSFIIWSGIFLLCVTRLPLAKVLGNGFFDGNNYTLTILLLLL